ncbi:hypothetical protein VTK73DRAFT_5375 [Phialemonium thermophilum]|uniref:Bud22 domain-containing protein n=1 Tax=Phialemonium thermophilum TaxID=223376 RepID=A0ABR3XX35_9PEZI
MPKRKRTNEEAVEEKFEAFRQELFRALKTAKGFERQRLAKRVRDAKNDPAKLDRLEKEIAVLKSLDLHQSAHAHLCAALLKVKGVADSPDLPQSVKVGVPKPEISEEEKAILHNVTSALYNKKPVLEVQERAVHSICSALGVAVPDKKGRNKKDVGSKGQTRGPSPSSRGISSSPPLKMGRTRREGSSPGVESDEEAEDAISDYDAFLGGSSSDDGESILSSVEEADPMAITSDEDANTEESEFEGWSLDEDEKVPEMKDRGFVERDVSSGEGSSDEEGASIPRPTSRSAKKSPNVKGSKRSSRPTDSTFLPSLMGGYISGSESASDIDEAPAPRRNKRGQRARRAIWEKKYKDKARHLNLPRKDQGWDPRRGAVDEKPSKVPWKRGVKSPLSHQTGQQSGRSENANAEPLQTRTKPKQDNTGPLHPSWEAKRKAKEKLGNVTFQGKKITFD